MNGYIQKIVTRKMTRKEFLSYLGLFLLTVFGISAALRNLSALNPSKARLAKKVAKSSFGAGAYGV